MVINDALIGRQIGNYRLLVKIGGGSFSSVYQGKHVIFEDEPVAAIKILHTALQSQQEHLEFIKEAQLLKKLRHRHILHILDAGFQGAIPYLVTEYAAGGSLRERLSKYNGQPLPVDEALVILTEIGEALQYAHQQRVVHRDLKPENILFNAQGEVLLADFGIAVLLASTRTGQVGFSRTPSYMAPEQFEGLASTKSDQYALGCIAYELVEAWS
jgi:serine/threonine protein kinase